MRMHLNGDDHVVMLKTTGAALHAIGGEDRLRSTLDEMDIERKPWGAGERIHILLSVCSARHLSRMVVLTHASGPSPLLIQLGWDLHVAVCYAQGRAPDTYQQWRERFNRTSKETRKLARRVE